MGIFIQLTDCTSILMKSYEKILRDVTPTDAQQKLSSIIDYFLVLTVGENFTLWHCKFDKVPL